MHSAKLKESKIIETFHPIFSNIESNESNELNNVESNELNELNNVEISSYIPVKVIKVYDGDTITIQFHLFNDNNNIIVKYNARLYGIDTAEIKGGTESSKEMANNAKLYVKKMCNKNDNLMYATFIKKTDKYGRLLINLYDNINGINDNKSINDNLINLNLAKSYMGKKKELF